VGDYVIIYRIQDEDIVILRVVRGSRNIEELFKELSDLQQADPLNLIFRLFKVYRKVVNAEESFDKFYFWGDMLLRDFDEVDKYLVPAAMLFKDLSALRELDETFDYLTGEQKKFLLDFWQNFEDKSAGSKEEFLEWIGEAVRDKTIEIPDDAGSIPWQSFSAARLT